MGIKSGNPEWKDYPDESTPVTAQALNNIEDALDAITAGGGGGGMTLVPSFGDVWSGPKNASASSPLSSTRFSGTAWPCPRVPITGVRFFVATAGAAGSTCQFAVYGSEPETGKPVGPRLYSGTADVSATGWKMFTFAPTAPKPGPLVWVFFGSTDTNVRLASYNNNSYGAFVPIGGGSSYEAQRAFYLTALDDSPVVGVDSDWQRQPTFDVRF